MKAHVIILALLFYKFSYNCLQFLKAKLFYNMYHDYLNSRDPNFSTYISSIKKLFENAGVDDVLFPETRPNGYGQLVTFKASVIQNLDQVRPDLISYSETLFLKTIGVYRKRIFETFSPFYWMQTIIFLPASILSYLGAQANSFFVKLFQVIWWFFTPIAIIYRDKITIRIIEFFSNL